jgi:ATPase subunit of ABC transporter with duplicated ATPase domains
LQQVSFPAPERNLFNCLHCVDKALAHVPRDRIREQLLEVGFDSSRQNEIVGGLSGGWKMKLELARAMLYNADLLLLDEVCHSIYEWLPTGIECLLCLT